jgi:arylsulfatase A-like enzyme
LHLQLRPLFATNCHHCHQPRELATVATIATNSSATSATSHHLPREQASSATSQQTQPPVYPDRVKTPLQFGLPESLAPDHPPMRTILIIALALLSAPLALGLERAPAPARPNIVFILADDLGRNDCGFMGGTEIKTPQLDKLASAGAKLDAFYVQPVCSPTRAALMTGRYPIRHGLQVGVVRPWAQYGLPLEEVTLPQALKSAGYTTAIFGKWHLGHFKPEYLPTRRGFDRQYGHYNGAIDYFTHIRDGGFDWHRDDKECRDEGYATQLLAGEACKFIELHAAARDSARPAPFFLYLPFNAVHAPHQVPEKYLEPYASLKGERKKYAGMLAAMDEAVGEVVDAIEKAGMRENTLFIFSSDNGGPQPGRVTDNGPYRAGKGTVYEGGARVAAFVTYDGVIKPGATITAPLHMVDWMPTLAKLTGATAAPTEPQDGRDIWPTLTQGKPTPHEEILLNATVAGGAIRVGDYKLVLKTGRADPETEADTPEAKSAATAVELYNLAADPYEKQNLAAENPEIVRDLQKRYDKYLSEAVPPKNRPKPRNFNTPKIWGEP